VDRYTAGTIVQYHPAMIGQVGGLRRSTKAGAALPSGVCRPVGSAVRHEEELANAEMAAQYRHQIRRVPK
jgi:hypothetical protein